MHCSRLKKSAFTAEKKKKKRLNAFSAQMLTQNAQTKHSLNYNSVLGLLVYIYIYIYIYVQIDSINDIRFSFQSQISFLILDGARLGSYIVHVVEVR